MADDSTQLRKVLLLGPQTQDGALWRALLSTSYGPGPKPVTAKSYGLRVLLQTADTQTLKPDTTWATGGKAPVDFHVPQLIQLAAGGGRQDDPHLSPDWLALVASRAYLLQAVQQHGGDIEFGLPAVAPVFTPPEAGRAAWPRPPLDGQDNRTWGEMAVPPFRLVDGRIRVRVSAQMDGAGDRPATWLDLARKKAFGGLDIAVSPGTTFTMDLVPDGIEFEAGIANPFIAFMPSGSAPRMWVRLRLVSVIGPNGAATLALDLIGPAEGKPEQIGQLRAAMAAMASSLRQPGNPSQMSPLALRPNLTGAVPVLRWLLDGTSLPDGGSTVDLPVQSVLPAVMTGRITGGALASTAEIAASRVFVSRRGAGPGSTTRLTVSAQPQAGTPPPPASEPRAKIEWVPSGPQSGFSFALAADTGTFRLGIDRQGLEDRLTDLYGAANVLPPGYTRAPYAYLLTEGGVAQFPLSIGALPAAFDPGRMPRPSQVLRGAIQGRIHIDMEPPARPPAKPPVKRQVDIDACAELIAVATWADKSLTGVTITATAPAGALSGFLWAAEASPSALEVVPTLRGGPAATRDLPLLLGADPDPLLQVDCTNFSAGQGSVVLTLSGPGPLPSAGSQDVPAPVTVWSQHPRLPLISAIAMTRTVESAVVPSLSRGLVPYVLAGERAYSLPDGTLTNGWRLPLTLDLGATRPAFAFAKAQTDGLLAPSGWPWPDPAQGGNPLSWPKSPAVPLVLPTLPGVEFTPAQPDGYAGLGLATALRFDLPGLDEYFAAVTPRRTPAAPGDSPGADSAEAAVGSGATSLAPELLREAWQAAADRLALTRTELARATPWVMPGQGAAPQQQQIKGLLEPFQWIVQCSFAETAPATPAGAHALPFGTFSIAQTGGAGATIPLAGADALAGLSGWLTLNGNALSWSKEKPDKSEVVPVAGFAVPARLVGGASIDTRGLATAAMPWDPTAPAQLITGGGRIHLRAAGASPGLTLATLTQSIPLQLGDETVRLWFANLPLEANRFDGASNPLEASPGPNERLFDRETISRARFEWRLFDGDGPERFDLALGPLRFRPLRLWEVQLEDGADASKIVRQVKVLGRVLAAPAGETDGPYGEDVGDAGGNVVALTFTGTPLTLSAITGQSVGDDADQHLALTDAIAAEVSFTLSPSTDWAGVPTTAHLPLDLRLRLGVADGKVTFAQAGLRGWLFGAKVKLTGQAVVEDDSHLKVTWDAPSLTGDLRLSNLTLDWTPASRGSETLSGTATLVITVLGAPRPAPGPVPEKERLGMVQLELGRTLSWLGLSRDASTNTETVIDHRRGLILCQLRAGTPPKNRALFLFSGLPLTAPQVTGVIAVALGAGPTASWMVTAGTVRLRAEASGAITLVRHVLTRTGAGTPWASRLSLDGTIAAPSRISWPLYDWSPPASAKPERLDSVPLPTKGVTQTFGAARLTLAHQVTVRLRDHELPAAYLTQVGPPGTWQLSQAWNVLALVTHELKQVPQAGEVQPDAPRLTWRTLDHVTIDGLQRLVTEAGAPSADYAFLPRYVNDYKREGGQGTANPHVKHPGIIQRAFANAGFPTAEMAALLSGLGAAETSEQLVVSGAGVARVRIVAGSDPAEGDASVLLSLPWLVGVGSLPPGLAFTQDGGGVIEVSPVDVAVSYPLPAGGTARRVTIPFPNPRAIAGCIRQALRLEADEDLPPLMPVDQSITRATAAPTPDIAKRPLWLHALQAVARLWPLAVTHPASMEGRVASLVVSGRSDGRSALLAFADPEEPPQEPDPQARVFVLSREGLSKREYEGTIATRQDWGQLLQIARSVVADPLAVVGGLVELVDAERSDFETLWAAFSLPPSDDFGGTARPLRQDVLHASAALGWPSGAKVSELALLAPGIGPEQVLQDTADANLASGLAGRVRTHSFAARASKEAADSVFLGFSMRPVFTRPDLSVLPGPPAPHLSAAPPRRRLPLAIDLQAELARMSASSAPSAGEEGAPTPPVYPLVPPQVEVMTLGARPGVLYLHRTDAAMALTADPPAAPAPFGRPAGAGPAVVSHGRAPRSGPYPRNADTDTTWRTVVGADDHDEDGLRPFRWLRGPAALLPQREPNAASGTVILRVIAPDLGRISAQWDGRLTLSATMPGAPQASADKIRNALTAHLEPDGGGPFTALDARLLVGVSAFAFTPLHLPDPAPGGLGRLSLELRMPQAALSKAQAALAVASADTRIVVTMGDAGPRAAALTPVSRLLRFPLALTTAERATLPVDMATLLFTDPAYDRTLSGPTASALTHGEDGETWLAATDRTGYDLATPVLFAAGQLNDGRFAKGTELNKVSFAILRAAREGSGPAPQREQILLAAAPPPPAGQTSYEMKAETAYRVVLTGFVGLDQTPVAFRPGDQLVLSFSLNRNKVLCEIAVSVLDQALLPPAEAVYSLVALRGFATTGADVRGHVPLHACAPLPQTVDHPHLLEDLARGIVRRRAIFQWTHPLEALRAPIGTAPDLKAALVKIDRSGGGQLPDALSDLQPLEE